jgi:Protein of unknown function (DUF559)
MDSQVSPFTRADALRRGYTDKQLCGPRFQRLFQGVYLPAGEVVSVLQRARAALMIAPDGSYASHHTAAALWGAAAPATSDTHICVPPSGPTRSIRKGIVAHRADPRFAETRHRGLLLAKPEAVFAQMGAVAPDLVELVVLGDSLVRAGRTTPEELVEMTRTWDGRGARRARRAAGLVRTGVDSPMETRLRMLIVLAGFPEPVVNFIIRHRDGEWSVRLDLSYPKLKLIIEYDGWQHRLEQQQWSRDLQRREWLESRGWRIVVINSDAFYGEPLQTLLRIRAAMVDRGHAGLPLRQPAIWTRQFVRPVR